MLGPILAALLCATPATGLALSAELGKVGTPASTYLDAIEQELVASGIPVKRLSLKCAGDRECLLKGAKELPALVAVTVAYGKKQTTIDLEALRVADATTVSQLTFSVTSRLAEADRAAVRKFGSQLAAALPAEPVADAPRVEPKSELTPAAPAEKVEVIAPAPVIPQKRSSAPGWILGGGTVAAAAVSGIFLGLATDARGRLESTPDPSPLTRTQADSLAAEANRDYSIALATGAAAGALLTATIVWIVTE
jgi:hypothetical protein